MSDLEKYNRCLFNGDCEGAYRIECKHGLDGFTPELVSIGLDAIENGFDPYKAIDEHLEGSSHD